MSNQVTTEVTENVKAFIDPVLCGQQKPTPDSMDTCQTVPVDSFSDEYEDEICWGRLFPVGSSFNALGTSTSLRFKYQQCLKKTIVVI